MHKLKITAGIIIFLFWGLLSAQPIISLPGEDEHFTDPYADQGLVQWRAFKKSQAWNQRISGQISPLTQIQELGPMHVPGRVRSMVIDPVRKIYLAIATGGGIWKFSPIDHSWTPVNDQFPNLAFSGIIQDPHHPNTILATTGDPTMGIPGAGIFRSDDQGATFVLMENTGSQKNTDFYYSRFISYHPIIEGLLFWGVGKNGNDHLYRSDDQGKTWSKVLNCQGILSNIAYSSENRVFVTSNRQGIFISEHNGVAGSFDLIKALPNNPDQTKPNFYQGIDISFCKSNPTTGYALFASDINNASTPDPGIYKTQDGGKTWKEVSHPGKRIPYSQPGFAYNLTVSPQDPELIATGGLLWGYSRDGGQSWTRGYSLEVDFHTMVFDPESPNRMYVGYDQGMGMVDFDSTKVKQVIQDNQKVQINDPQAVEIGKAGTFFAAQIYNGDFFPSGNGFIMGAQDWGFQLTYDDGFTERDRAGDGGSAYIHKQNPEISYASTQYGRIYRCTSTLTPGYARNKFTFIMDDLDQNHDGKIDEGVDFFITKFVINESNGDELYFPTKENIYASLDQGNHWESIYTLNGKRVLDLAIVSGNQPTLYIVYIQNNTYGLIRITSANTVNPIVTDFENAIPIHFGYPLEISEVSNSPNTVLIGTTSGKVLQIDLLDQKPKVKDLTGDLPETRIRDIWVYPEDPDNLILAGTSLGLFYTIDGGAHWILESNIPYTAINQIRYREHDQTLFLFTYGRGTWKAILNPISTSVTNEIEDVIIQYPNPFDHQIHLTSQKNYNYTIRVYDISGHLIDQSAFSNKATLSTSAWPSGAYILHVVRKGNTVKYFKIWKN